MKKSDFGVVGIIYAIAIWFLVMTLDLPDAAQTYPLVLISALIALNTLYLVRVFGVYMKTRQIENDIPHVFKGFMAKQFAGVSAWIVGYLVLMHFFGYYISSVAYLIGSMLFLRVKPIPIAITVILLAAMVAAVFSSFLNVPLPVGVFFE